MGCTLLVVDDDDSIRDITGLALETVGGHRVLSADGGRQALEIARQQRPDAVLLDVMMPGMDGPTTLRHMRADPQLATVPVILLTAKVTVGGRQVWEGLDVVGVIPKPFDPMALSHQVEELLGW
jgi:CheY-like chemotaxis protein